MIKHISFSDFCDEFSDTYKNNFSYDGKRVLFDYLESLEDETNEKIELDTVAICCDYTEYESLKAVQENYGNIKDLSDLRDHTTVIEIPNTERIIIQNY